MVYQNERRVWNADEHRCDTIDSSMIVLWFWTHELLFHLDPRKSSNCPHESVVEYLLSAGFTGSPPYDPS